MLIVKDHLEENSDVMNVDSSDMFKVLLWENGFQLVCKFEGDAGVHVYRDVLWCAGDITLARNGSSFTYSGEGSVSLKTQDNPITLAKLDEHHGAIVVKQNKVLAVPEEYTISEVTDGGYVTIAGTGTVPLELTCEAEELVTITISGESSVFVQSDRPEYWSAGLKCEVLKDPAGLFRFTGAGTIVLAKGH